ncbi:MAG TPA: GNAT family N-acetyltransferase [Bacillota bacterium]|nr:GNAT family N-acetyltransferase [Bacillota bacterium]
MIREAEAIDREALQGLYQSLAPEAPVKVTPERIEEIKDDPHNFLWVFEENGVVIGTVFLTLALNAMFGSLPFGVIENVVVDSAHRGQGVGSRLIDHAVAFCKEQKCVKVMLMSSIHRKEAHAFYERKGFDGSAKKGFVLYCYR